MLHNRLMMVLTCIVSVCLGVSAALLSYSEALISVDETLTNAIYQYNLLAWADSRITLVTLEAADETPDGNGGWSRQQLAAAVNTAAANDAAVIGLDVDLSKEGTDAAGNTALEEACANAGNVVAFASVTFDSRQESDDSLGWSDRTVTDLTLPYDALSAVVTSGIANATRQSADGSIRHAALALTFNGKQYDSFAAAVYKHNQDALGLSYNLPELDRQELFAFNAIWNTSTYQMIPLDDLVAGRFDPTLLSDHIVLIGAYQAPSQQGLVDGITMRRESQDLLLQASVIQSLLKERTVVNVNPLLQAVLFGSVIFLFYLFFANRKIWFMFFSFGLYIVVFYVLSSIANTNGQRVLLLIPFLYGIAALVLMLLQHVLLSTLQRRKMEKTLKLYMDSSVVDEITEADPTSLAKLSQRKDIAVLFVDVRGFTTLSEGLEPEQVVEILNAYFTVVANAINRWGGTIDKFIGDAAMAIFNAPKPLPDYCFYALCAADDIMKGFDEMKGIYEKKYDHTLGIGIGVNAGEAIVGNIGCYSRMDYTAIGDTVNTASRLESNAAPGQILISASVVKAVRERAQVRLVGNLTLKGKANTVKSYESIHIDKPRRAPAERKEFLSTLAEHRERVGALIEENKERVGALIEENKERVGDLIEGNKIFTKANDQK